MKSFANVPLLENAQELLAILEAAPRDRMLVYGNDLLEDEWDGNGFATRNDHGVLLVVEGGDVPEGRVVGVVGSEQKRDRLGRQTPDDICALMSDAEFGSGPLAWVYDGAFALPAHPRAETSIS